MADLPETSEFTEGVRAFESTDPARYDVLNNALQPLVNRTKWLKDSMRDYSPIQWISGTNQEILLSSLQMGKMYTLDVRTGNTITLKVDATPDLPIGAEWHFVCAGDPISVTIVADDSLDDLITAAGLQKPGDGPIFNKNGSVITIKKIGAGSGLIFGDIAEGDSVGFL